MLYFLAISKMLAGIGLFLLGMNFLEEALRKLAGRSFKLFLRNQTTNKFKAIAGGAIVTGVLQSSSVVNLMVLAFVGAGVITMQNALAVILGSNIGTTLTSWLVATLGFTFNIESFSLPIIGLSGLALALFRRESKAFHWSKFMFGFGSLFLGLDYMKVSFGDMAQYISFEYIRQYPAIFFVLVGFFLTSIIQSSSATVAIVLSALNADALSLYSATAIVLGSEVGTTIKLLLASMHGVPAKKRVALGNFMYNTLLIIAVYFALDSINYLLTSVLKFSDPLLALVFFQSFINVAGVLVFFPFLTVFERFLERRFTDDKSGARYIKIVPAKEGDLALEALEKETKRYIHYTLDFLLHAFDLEGQKQSDQVEKGFHDKSFSGKYDYLKLLHGEIHSYYIGMNKEMLDNRERERAEHIISAIRNSMFSAKSIKDSYGDIDQLRNSSSSIKYQVYLDKKKAVEDFGKMLNGCLLRPTQKAMFDDVVALYDRVQKGYAEQLKRLYQQEASHQLSEVDISTLVNFNREFYASYKAIVWAIKDYLLEEDQSRYFAELPGFIR